jgi:diguanylate cyclase (GGDEF)-like protein
MEPRTLTLFAGSLSFCLCVAFCVVALHRRRSTPAAGSFALLTASGAVYVLAYTFEINSGSMAAAILWLKVEIIGISLLPVFWFLFAESFVSGSRRVGAFRLALLSAVPLATIALAWTNEYHGLVFRALFIVDGSPLSVLTGPRGPWFWAAALYSYALVGYGSVSILAQISRSSGKLRGQTIVIAAAVILPWIGNFLLIFHASPYGLDLTPFLLSGSGLLVAWSMLRFGMLDLSHIAKATVVDALRVGVIALDSKGRIVDMNRAARAALPELGRAKPGDDAEAVLHAMGIEAPGRAPQRDYPFESGGALRWYRFERHDMEEDGRSRGSLIIVSEVTEARELMARLERLAATDELTGVDNRRRFFEHAQREMELARRRDASLSFAMLDLDRFKAVNDAYGHDAGDAALVAVCAACRSALRSTDLLCRYGGEEFLIIFPEASPAEAAEIVERVRARIEALRVVAPSASFGVTASFGVAGSTGAPREDLEVYLRRCDEGLYRAKAEGRNRVALCAETGSCEAGAEARG